MEKKVDVERPLVAAQPAAGDEAAKNADPKPQQKEDVKVKREETGGGWGGGGGWGLPFSFDGVLKAAEEISRNAMEAAKSITESQPTSSEGEGTAVSGAAREVVTEEDRIRQSALDRLERASEDSLLGQGIKAIDSSVETIASGTWSVLGNAWRGGSYLVQKLESSASSLAETIQDGSITAKAASLAPSIIETGKSFTTKGIEVLERVSKETVELLIEETGLEVENEPDSKDQEIQEEQSEDLSFDRCFYIYGGPEQLEELGALSSHYALLFNRKKAKLDSEQKSFYDAKLREVQQIFNLTSELEEVAQLSHKGKSIETADTTVDIELKKLRDSSISKAAKMAAGFAAVIAGLAPNEIIQRATDRLETIHSEGVHRLSEFCCLAVSELLTLGKSVISAANNGNSEEGNAENDKIDWPEDCISKAKIIRWKAVSVSTDVQKVSSSFCTGIADIAEAYLATIQSADRKKGAGESKSVPEKARAMSDELQAGQSSAREKIQEAVGCLSYVVICSSMPAA